MLGPWGTLLPSLVDFLAEKTPIPAGPPTHPSFYSMGGVALGLLAHAGLLHA